MRFILTICLFLIFFNSTIAQVVKESEGTYQEEEFFADQKKDKPRLAIKTDVFTALIGQIPLLAEVRLSRDFSVEVGVFYLYNELFMPMGENSDLKEFYDVIPSYGGTIEGRYYIDRAFNSGSGFVGLRYKYKKVEREAKEPFEGYDPSIISDTYNAIIFMWGQQYTFNDRFLFEYTVGLGYSHAVFFRYKSDGFGGPTYPVEFKPNFLDDGHAPLILQVGLRFGVFAF